MRPIEGWANREGVSMADAIELRRLMRRRHSAGEAECNGDPHPRAKDKTDKNECAALWGTVGDALIVSIQSILSRYGMVFDGGTGLWGSIKKDGRYIGDVPSEGR